MQPSLSTKQKKNCWTWGRATCVAFALVAYLVSFNVFFSFLCAIQKSEEEEHEQGISIFPMLPDADPFVKELLEGVCLGNQYQVKPPRRKDCVMQVATVDAEQNIRSCSPFQGGSNTLFGLKWCAWASHLDGHISADILVSRVPGMEQKPMEAFRAALHNKTRGIVIDAGAQVGLYTAAALSAGHYTVSIDMRPEHVQMNLVSRALNNMNNETNGLIVNGALSNQCGQWATAPRQFQEKGNPGSTHITQDRVSKGWPLMKTLNEFRELDKVPVLTLDSIMDHVLQTLPVGVQRKVHALKIDIEGYEPWALMGATRLLSNLKPDVIIMELFVRHIPNCNATRFLQSLAQLGYLVDVSPRLNVKCVGNACMGMGFESPKFNNFLHHLSANAEMDLVLRKI